MKTASARKRLTVSLVLGLIAGAGVSALASFKFGPIAAWDTAAFIYVAWVWLSVWPMSPADTKEHAVTENPGRAVADVLLLAASLASLVAVALLIISAGNTTGAAKTWQVFLGLISVVVSWGVVHTNYALRYARLYYGDPEGGIDFNEVNPPQYKDFAYLAFTLGMTFQVSDTDLKTKEIRQTALKHAFLSYLFGTIIIATTINTIASLAK